MDIPIPIVIFIVFSSTIIIFIIMVLGWKRKLVKRGIRLSLTELASMSIRKTLNDEMLEALELADDNKFYVKPFYLEQHLIHGGNPRRLIQIIVNGKAEGEVISFKEAASMDLGDITLDEARKLYAKALKGNS